MRGFQRPGARGGWTTGGMSYDVMKRWVRLAGSVLTDIRTPPVWAGPWNEALAGVGKLYLQLIISLLILLSAAGGISDRQ